MYMILLDCWSLIPNMLNMVSTFGRSSEQTYGDAWFSVLFSITVLRATMQIDFTYHPTFVRMLCVPKPCDEL